MLRPPAASHRRIASIACRALSVYLRRLPHVTTVSGNTSGNIARLPIPHPLPPYQHHRHIKNQNTGKNGKQKSGNISGNIPTSGNTSRLPPTPNFSHLDGRCLPGGNDSGNIGNDSGNKIGNTPHRHTLAYSQSTAAGFAANDRQALAAFRRGFNRRLPTTGNISGNKSGNISGNHPPIHHRPPCTSQKTRKSAIIDRNRPTRRHPLPPDTASVYNARTANDGKPVVHPAAHPSGDGGTHGDDAAR